MYLRSACIVLLQVASRLSRGTGSVFSGITPASKDSGRQIFHVTYWDEMLVRPPNVLSLVHLCPAICILLVSQHLKSNTMARNKSSRQLPVLYQCKDLKL